MEAASVKRIFDPRLYLDKFYSHLRQPQDKKGLSETMLVKLHDFISRVPRGESVLNFGAGPTIYAVISASAKFSSITLADYTEDNRAELTKWINNDKDKFDWSPFFNYIAHLEENEIEEQRVRDAIKAVVHCDVYKDPVVDCANPMFDAIIITLCLEEACKDFESLKEALRKLATILKQGGHLILFICVEETFYNVGDMRIDVTSFKEIQIREAIECSKLRLVDEHVYWRNPQSSKDVDDYKAVFGVLAKKL